MSKSPKPRFNQKVNTTIQRLGVHGEGIGYWHGYTLFIDHALPGEVVQARVIERKKRYGRGRLIELKAHSLSRTTPPCPYFERCGGCQLMHLDYSGQLEMKRQRVVDALERIGKFQGLQVNPCIASPNSLSYRNKIQVAVDGKLFGFFSRRSRDLVEVDHCHIHCELGERIYRGVRNILRKISVELRYVIVKTAVNTGQVLVILVTRGKEKLSKIAHTIIERFPEVKGVIQNINPHPHNVVLGDEFHVLVGESYIQERLCGMTFKISSSSFFQVNTTQAEQVYEKAMEFADLKGNEVVLDAYCGIGTLSLLLAKKAQWVIGTECVQQAIDDAKENADFNQISNATFCCTEAENWIPEHVDVAVLNPPRKGCEPTFLKKLCELKPKRIVYISCDPATLARDLGLLHEMHYAPQEIQPFDMFPQTAHVETVVQVSRRP